MVKTLLSSIIATLQIMGSTGNGIRYNHSHNKYYTQHDIAIVAELHTFVSLNFYIIGYDGIIKNREIFSLCKKYIYNMI